MFKACQLDKQQFETSIRVKRQCEMGLTEVGSHKTLQLVYWVPKVVGDVLASFSTQLSGNLAIQTTPFPFLSFLMAFLCRVLPLPKIERGTSANWWHGLLLLSCFTLKKLNPSCLHCARFKSLIWLKPWDLLPVADLSIKEAGRALAWRWSPSSSSGRPNPTMSSADSISVGLENKTTNR